MAGLAVSVSSPSTAEPFGSISIGTFTVTGTNVPTIQGPTLAASINTIAVPAGTYGFVIAPPTGNVNQLKLLGSSSDTGISIPPATPTVYFVDPSHVPANIYINAAASVTGITQIVFF